MSPPPLHPSSRLRQADPAADRAVRPAALLTLSRAAQRLGRAVITLRRWHKAGLLPLVTINNRHYVEPSELAALLARHRRGRPDAPE